MARRHKRALVLGLDGYIGWPLACDLQANGWEVFGVDDYSRREYVKAVGSTSAIPIEEPHERLHRLWDPDNLYLHYWYQTVGKDGGLMSVMKMVKPDVIFHLAQMPSAPFSMRNPWYSINTYTDNIRANLSVLWAMRIHAPEAHLVKLGTMGEYGTPGVPIPEGEFGKYDLWTHDDHQRYLEGMQFPRKPGSIYHSSKVADSVNCEMLARLWDLRISDIMQGVVYGTRSPSLLSPTRLDVDESFGTVINRFCAQGVLSMPLTVYGQGGQTRGFLPLQESIQCLQLVAENPPKPGRYEVYNQFGSIHTIQELANYVRTITGVTVQHVDNPRKEEEEHTYEVANDKLKALGYEPADNPGETILGIIEDLRKNIDPLKKLEPVIHPKTKWK